MKRRRLLEIHNGIEIHKFAKDVSEAMFSPEKLETEPDHAIYVESEEMLSQIFSPGKLKILRVLDRKEGISISALAKKLGRPRESVSRDLKELGLQKLIQLKRDGKKQLVSPRFDQITISLKG